MGLPSGPARLRHIEAKVDRHAEGKPVWNCNRSAEDQDRPLVVERAGGDRITRKVEYENVPDRVDMVGIGNPDYLDRVVDSEVAEALASSPAVLIEGPRGCGKTWTGQRFARSEIMLDGSESLRMAAEVDPNSILEGEEPRLLDEWQMVRGIWNPMCHACDRRGGSGTFCLLGPVHIKLH